MSRLFLNYSELGSLAVDETFVARTATVDPDEAWGEIHSELDVGFETEVPEKSGI